MYDSDHNGVVRSKVALVLLEGSSAFIQVQNYWHVAIMLLGCVGASGFVTQGVRGNDQCDQWLPQR